MFYYFNINIINDDCLITLKLCFNEILTLFPSIAAFLNLHAECRILQNTVHAEPRGRRGDFVQGIRNDVLLEVGELHSLHQVHNKIVVKRQAVQCAKCCLPREED